MKKLNNMGLFKKRNDFSLESEYINALKEDDFKSLVSTIDLSNDELMKYTSRLQICSKEKNNCSKCKSLDKCLNEVKGFALTTTQNEDKLSFDYTACKYKRNDIEEHNKNIYLNAVPESIATAKMKEIYVNDKNRKEVILWLQKFLKEYDVSGKNKGLYLHGSFGCGKTYLIAAAINELSKKNVRGVILYWPEFLRDLKASFDSYFSEKFEAAKRAKILLIDDIGAENMTSWARDEILAPILQYRMDSNLTTFFTSNLSLSDLETHLSVSKGKVDLLKAKRIIERIDKLSDVIEMNSENLRK